MKCKTISFFICLFMSVTLMSKSNKIETLNTQTENKYISKEKVKRIKKVKKVVKKNKKDKELEYWSNVVGKKVTKITKIDAKLSFYTSLDSENYEGCNGITASGVKLFDGVVANNYWNMGTVVYFKGYGEYEVLDTGGKGLNTWNNFDMYIPRLNYESDSSYFKRVNNKGIKNTTGYILDIAE